MSEKICLVTMMRFTLQEAIMFVNYHLNIGVDRIIIYFDDPADPAIEALSGNDQVFSIRCDSAHWASFGVEPTERHVSKQEVNATAGLQMARTWGFDWIIHIDQDELLFCKGSFRAALANTDKSVDVVRILPMEAVPERDHYSRPFEEITLFRVLPLRMKRLAATALLCGQVFPNGNYFHGHTFGKAASRISPSIERLAAHGPKTASGVNLHSRIHPEIKLLHIDCMGFAAWKRKWTRRLALGARSCGMHDHREWQLDAYRAVQESGNENRLRSLYRSLYSITAIQKFVLMRLGLLERVRLDSELFSDPADHSRQIEISVT